MDEKEVRRLVERAAELPFSDRVLLVMLYGQLKVNEELLNLILRREDDLMSNLDQATQNLQAGQNTLNQSLADAAKAMNDAAAEIKNLAAQLGTPDNPADVSTIQGVASALVTQAAPLEAAAQALEQAITDANTPAAPPATPPASGSGS